MSREMNRTVAEIFYQQCAGTTSGHMANVPNNPVLYSLLSAYLGDSPGSSDCYAINRAAFADMLREMSEALFIEL